MSITQEQPYKKRTRTESQREYQRTRRRDMVIDRGPKPVKIIYPGVSIPDWMSKAEFRRNEREFTLDTIIYIDGKVLERQLELL